MIYLKQKKWIKDLHFTHLVLSFICFLFVSAKHAKHYLFPLPSLGRLGQLENMSELFTCYNIVISVLKMNGFQSNLHTHISNIHLYGNHILIIKLSIPCADVADAASTAPLQHLPHSVSCRVFPTLPFAHTSPSILSFCQFYP